MKKHNDQSIKEVLLEWMETYKHRHRFYQSNIRSIWSQKMGTTINGYTRDIRLVKDVVYITIDSASLRQEMTYARQKIKEMLNAELGDNQVREVIIR